MKDLRTAVVSLVLFSVALGVGYPLVIGLVSRLVFPEQATGSLLRDNGGAVIGSRLVGQPVTDPAYFWPRPSALPEPRAMTSSGTNAGPSGFIDDKGTLGPNPVLVAAVRSRIAALRAADPGNAALVPIDLVTASGSGLDPDISPAAAYYQVTRVARARGLEPQRVRHLVQTHVEGRSLGLLGEPRVNVLALNRSLEALR
jgi:potassium-transporting ATPase KdpC subunit